jgi:beta-galactosidase
MRKLSFIPFLLLWLHPTSQAQTRISLDEDWRFHFGHAANPEKDFNYGLANIFSKSGKATGTAMDPSFNDSSWRRLNLPHDWAVELPFVYKNNSDLDAHGYKPVGGLFPETSIGWYRKQFRVSAADSGQRFGIRFDGIFRNAQVWMNGFYVGRNESGYLGITYDVTDFIRYDRNNVLVVRADASQYEGWFYEGAGIYRHTWLLQHNNLYLAEGGSYLHATIEGRMARLYNDITVSNAAVVAQNVTIQTKLFTRDGMLVAQSKPASLTVTGTSENKVQQSLSLTDVHRWQLDDPYLYRVVTEIRSGNQLVHRQAERFGFRTLRWDAQEGFFLNEAPLKLQGTNNHQDHAGVGAALPDFLQYYRIRELKRMGANAYRTSHNAPTPELLDACDSLGMLVLDEQRLLNSSAEYQSQFERLIRRDRNHPSVFLWSIGNEEGWIQANSFGKRMAQTFLAIQQKLDPSRTSTYAADLGNVLTGINEVIPVRGFNYRHQSVADYHRDHPNQPIIGTEMGSTVTTRGVYTKDSIRCYVPDQDITAPWWASTAEAWWKPAAENKYWAGGFIWTGFDYRGEPTPYQWPNINSHFGVMDVCGFPKNIYYYYQSWWSDKDVIHLSPHWNHSIPWGQPAPMIDVWVNSNATEVELLLNGKSLGRQAMPRNGHLQWPVLFEPGKLEAIGYKDGRQFATHIETTGAPAGVVLTPYKTTLLADGKDGTVMNVSIVDREGREVPDANNRVEFYISGPGKIIGVGNGDPSSHEPDQCSDGMWQRSAFNGKCQVIVQSTKEAGFIRFEAKAAGLWNGGTEIITVAPVSISAVHTDPLYQRTAEALKPRISGKMLGADISFLPELEKKGMQFTDSGQKADAVALLKKHGFNYVRLRIFADPANDSGYAPKDGFCDLAHTLAMAKRVKAAGMQFLLDFHYSDYWADPGKQYKPKAWRGLDFSGLKQALYQHTAQVMEALKAQGTLPDMVQVGNEINHGMVWPEGSIAHPDSLAQLIQAGIAAVKKVNPETIIMLHVALGGQYEETRFFFDELQKRAVDYDVMGLSYYPNWHGTLDDLRDNMLDLIRVYNKDIIVVEYSARKEAVNRIVFGLPGGRGKGTCIWEPLSTWEKIFDEQGSANEYLPLYDRFHQQYIEPKHTSSEKRNRKTFSGALY